MSILEITCSSNKTITPDQFIDILNRSGLAARRPVADKSRVERMLKNSNIVVSAWDKDKLVGISRAVTDFSFCCYLSDLAVDKEYQKQGIGKKLIEETHIAATDQTTLILLAAPDAINYYGKIGMAKIENGFIIKRKG